MSSFVTVSPLGFPAVPDKTFSVTVPGSKSYSNRALIISALAPGETVLTGFSNSKDSELLLKGFETLGIPWSQEGDTVIIKGGETRHATAHGTIDIGPAGTTMRFLTALTACMPNTDIILCGTERMHNRPIGVLVDALVQLGADITYLDKKGYPPIRVRGKQLNSSRLRIPGDISSQFLTAILLISPTIKDGLQLEVTGELVSESYLEMTRSIMGAFGVQTEKNSELEYSIASQQDYKPRQYRIEGDGSGASYFWGIGAITGSPVRVYNVSFDSAQGDCQFPLLLKEMGCSVSSGIENGTPWIEVYGRHPLRGITCDMTLMPDVAQTLAVVASFAEGATTMTGLSTLRVKETDRIDALHKELAKVGIHSKPDEDSLTVYGGSPHAGQIATYEDHRMAMSFALFGARVAGIRIEEPSVVEKSFPNFWSLLAEAFPLSITKG